VTTPGGWELVLILVVVLLLFGAKRLPDSARALGRSMRILKAETKGLRDDDDTDVAGHGRTGRPDTTVTAEPLPPVTPPPPHGYGQPQPGAAPQDPSYGTPPAGGTPHGDQAQQPRP